MFKIGLSRMLKRRVKTADTAGTYVFSFNYRGSTSFSDLLAPNLEIEFGACHADELLYVFPVVKNVMLSHIMTPEDHVMREQMVKMWTNFVKFGCVAVDVVEYQ